MVVSIIAATHSSRLNGLMNEFPILLLHLACVHLSRHGFVMAPSRDHTNVNYTWREVLLEQQTMSYIVRRLHGSTSKLHNRGSGRPNSGCILFSRPATLHVILLDNPSYIALTALSSPSRGGIFAIKHLNHVVQSPLAPVPS